MFHNFIPQCNRASLKSTRAVLRLELPEGQPMSKMHATCSFYDEKIEAKMLI